MEAKKFLSEFRRMCSFYYSCTDGCEIGKILKDQGFKHLDSACFNFIITNPNKSESIVKNWAKNHPRISRQDAFLNKYPRATLDEDGILQIYPCELGIKIIEDTCYGEIDCKLCRRQYWLESADNNTITNGGKKHGMNQKSN